MTLPTIHPNGTGKQTLASHYGKARENLDAFRHAFGSIEFNARDYLPQGPDAFTAALDDRIVMIRHAVELDKYIDAHENHISEQP